MNNFNDIYVFLYFMLMNAVHKAQKCLNYLNKCL